MVTRRASTSIRSPVAVSVIVEPLAFAAWLRRSSARTRAWSSARPKGLER